ncbi:MAG: nucleotidyltransferase domain-containing protein [Nitrospiraceae bacterium]
MGLRRTVADLTAREQAALADFQRRVGLTSPGVSARYTVFGSRARGTADSESDLDVCVELGVERLSFADKQKVRRIAGEVSLAHDILLSVLVIDRVLAKERGDFSIMTAIREEGIPL